MEDLVAFVRARLDEREAKARDAVQESPTWSYDYQGLVEGGDNVWSGLTEFSRHGDQLGEFIADNDPAFVLDDVAAKRQILKLHRPYQVTTANDGLNWCYTRCAGCEPIDRELEPNESYWPCPNLRLLALPHAGHPDYRGEWKP